MDNQNTTETPSQQLSSVQGHTYSKSTLLLIGFLFLVIGGTGGYLLGKSFQEPLPQLENPQENPSETGCTLEAKLCPDGSSVGRSGPKCEFAPCPTIAEIQTTPVQDKDTTSDLRAIPTVSTDGWKTVRNNGISFKIPSDAKCNNDEACTAVTTAGSVLPMQIEVESYKGGSRREQFLGPSPFDCHYIYVESKFGSIVALQIASDGGWCQGGAGGIITVVGNKLVIFRNLNYDLETKIIYRWDIRDTIISTLKASEN